MILLYFLNLFITPILMLSTLAYKRYFWKLPFINPISIIFIIFLPVEIFRLYIGPWSLLQQGLLNKYYQFALLMYNIHLFFMLLVTVIFLRFLSKNQKFSTMLIRVNSGSLSTKKLFYLDYLFLILALLCFIVMAEYSFGFFNWIASPREGYQYHRTGVGSLYALSISFLSISYVIAMVRKSTNFSKIASIILYIILSYYFASKGMIISFFAFGLIILWFSSFRYLGFFFVVAGVLVASTALYNLFTAHGDLSVQSLIGYFDHYINSAMYYEAHFSGKLPLFLGKLFITDFWSLVPRGLYPDKPYIYGSLYINDFFYPGLAANTHTPGFGSPVRIYADFGLIGVILSSFFNISYFFKLYCFNIIFSYLKLNFNRFNPMCLLVVIAGFAPYFAHYMQGLIHLMFTIIIFFMITSVSMFSWKKVDYKVHTN